MWMLVTHQELPDGGPPSGDARLCLGALALQARHPHGVQRVGWFAPLRQHLAQHGGVPETHGSRDVPRAAAPTKNPDAPDALVRSRRKIMKKCEKYTYFENEKINAGPISARISNGTQQDNRFKKSLFFT